ncbi:MAG: sigma-54-dependent Fis family transcriptional regulator [Desulfobacter postgatei]|jgi:PAS domain S-box-containing protein|uniref:sigma-54-dependent Fis family transcriptional regulator n=1 Tax=Desulfobacter postgatei TaxID=2293 RepID=UPI0023F4B101|nr:sigma-54-dependent Fis family transcriptional regulator [Desulfobacter postgatei]MDD4273497.1 sigma-54-dependent Fis family transcriptional regulator [Desulfobacter postgatei]MDX9965257.1 sigma-54-dependent Fis family transcriptional regulator [Desulfobacter postgatei]
MKTKPGPDQAKHDILGQTARIPADMMWLFTFSSLCRRAMLHTADASGLLDQIVSAVESHTPYYTVCFKSVFYPESGLESGDNCTPHSGIDDLSPFHRRCVNPKIKSLKRVTDTDLPKSVQKRLGMKSGTLATALYFPINDPCEKGGRCQVFYVPSGYVPHPLELLVLEELSADLGKTLDRMHRNRGVEEQILELTRQKEMYHSVFENTGTGTIIIDPDMMILHVNAKFMALVGLERNEIENRMRWSQFVVPGDNEMMQNYHYGRRKGLSGIPTEYECRIFATSGDIRYIDMKVGMIPGTGRSIASFMDITKRKLAENRLRQSEAQLSDIIRTFEGLIYITSKDYKVEFMNVTLQEKAGRSGVGEKCYRLIHGLDSPCVGCRLESVLSGETRRWELKSPRDGRWYWSIQSPVYDNRGRIVKAQTIHMDITDRKRREEQISEDADLLRNENIVLRSAMKDRYRFENIVGKSPAMQKVYELVVRAAASNAPVIIYGESGTGKELVARAIHNLSKRSKKQFVPVNSGAISEHIIESEFFGYRKGAFTGAEKDKEGFLGTADGGTLFLDEIGDVGPNLQVKLLRAIEGGGYTPVGSTRVIKPDLRIVAATNKNLKRLVEKGVMREDFFYRVHIIPIRLPALRERKEDIPLLVDYFLSAFGDQGQILPMGGKIMEAFLLHDWPGNVRELQNVLHRYMTLGKIDFMETSSDCGADAQEQVGFVRESHDFCGSLNEIVAEFEKGIILNALEENRWQKARTALALGIHRKTLFTKMKKLGLE